jgi:hypothetical protein
MARLRNGCCRLNATIRSVFVVPCVDAAVSNIKLFIVAIEMQQWVPFSLVSNYRIFLTAVDNNEY